MKEILKLVILSGFFFSNLSAEKLDFQAQSTEFSREILDLEFININSKGFEIILDKRVIKFISNSNDLKGKRILNSEYYRYSERKTKTIIGFSNFYVFVRKNLKSNNIIGLRSNKVSEIDTIKITGRYVYLDNEFLIIEYKSSKKTYIISLKPIRFWEYFLSDGKNKKMILSICKKKHIDE